MLTRQLEGRFVPPFADPLRRAADEAAALAFATRYSVLVFPALFEQQAQAALFRPGRQQQIRQRSRELLAA